MNNFAELEPRQGSVAHRLTETETNLARLWAGVLKLDDVGIHDDYFALGGNSLLAVKLMAQIKTQFGTRLPLTSIIEAPTVAQLASLLHTQGSHSPVVLIRDGGNKPPLFLVHDADGETMLYRSLALHLDQARAIYGLQPFSSAQHPLLHTRIEEMAAFHIASIRKIQPRGCYLLGGLCAGGLIAFEMARQLERVGDRVALVAMLDVADVEAKERPLRLTKQRLNRVVSVIDAGNARSRLRRVATTAGTVLRKARNLAKYLTKSRLQMIHERTKMALFRLYLKHGLEMPAFLQNISVRTAYGYARRGYRPKTPFGGELVLIRATSGTGNDEPYAERYIDPLMGWSARTSRGVRTFHVPGGHSSMLQEPNVRVLAQCLQDYIDEIEKAHEAQVPPRPVPARSEIPARTSQLAPSYPQAPGGAETAPAVRDRVAVSQLAKTGVDGASAETVSGRSRPRSCWWCRPKRAEPWKAPQGGWQST